MAIKSLCGYICVFSTKKKKKKKKKSEIDKILFRKVNLVYVKFTSHRYG